MSADSKLPPPITPGQVKLIHVMLGKQGIDDDWYRELLEDLYGVDTCKKLTRKQANELLTRLGAGQKPKAAKPAQAQPAKPKPGKPTPPRRRDSTVAALATPAQHQLIHDLIHEIKWRMRPPAAAYSAWLQRNQSLDKVRTTAEASRVIRGLKALKTHQQGGQARSQ